jgi:hypothetical protein
MQVTISNAKILNIRVKILKRFFVISMFKYICKRV